MDMGKLGKAEDSIREAVELDPEEASYRGTLSSILGLRKRWKESLKAAEEGMELDPEDEICINARAMALIQLGRADEAGSAMESALRKNPDDSETHALMGWSMLHQGRATKAIDHYSEALQLDPESEFARHGLVESLKARNFLYRTVLRWFLLLTRIKSGWIILIMVCIIVFNNTLISIAKKVPALAPFVWPVLFLVIAFVLMTWVADPLFNLLLRFDSRGRHALTPKDVRQTNWLIGNLLTVVLFTVLWLFGIPGMGTAAILSAMLIIPLMTTLRGTSRKTLLVLGGYTHIMAAVGVYVLYLEYDISRFVQSLDTVNFSSDKMESFKSMQPDKIKALRCELESLGNAVSRKIKLHVMLKRRETANAFLGYFVLAWVAFTWLSGLVLARDDPD
jgi:tetratricopeptide (TPR) repeat protein